MFFIYLSDRRFWVISLIEVFQLPFYSNWFSISFLNWSFHLVFLTYFFIFFTSSHSFSLSCLRILFDEHILLFPSFFYFVCTSAFPPNILFISSIIFSLSFVLLSLRLICLQFWYFSSLYTHSFFNFRFFYNLILFQIHFFSPVVLFFFELLWSILESFTFLNCVHSSSFIYIFFCKIIFYLLLELYRGYFFHLFSFDFYFSLKYVLVCAFCSPSFASLVHVFNLIFLVTFWFFIVFILFLWNVFQFICFLCVYIFFFFFYNVHAYLQV